LWVVPSISEETAVSILKVNTKIEAAGSFETLAHFVLVYLTMLSVAQTTQHWMRG
jgi:hypothetical protein